MLKFSRSWGADERYRSTALENGVQVVPATRTLVALSINNTLVDGVVRWLGIWDVLVPHGVPGGNNPAGSGPTGAGNNPAAVSSAVLLDVTPIASPGWESLEIHGGDQLIKGLWVGLYSTAALAAAGGDPDAGAVLFVKGDWTASKYLPQN